MTRSQQPPLTAFAFGMVGLGVLALIYGDFAMVWQPVAAWVPGRTALAYASGVLMVVGGVGLLFRATAAWAARILFPYLLIWMCLKLPALFVAPGVEAVWLGFGEIAALFAGGWFLFARLAEPQEGSLITFLSSEKTLRFVKMFYGVWLIPIGLSHIVYVKETVAFVPAWLPYREGWAYLTGAGHIAAGLGVLFSVLPRVAAFAEAAMIGVFTILVWGPAIAASPKARLPWTAFFISWAIASAAWAVAQNITAKQPASKNLGAGKVAAA
ncbi:MAG TPA: hypothetical protein VNX88_02435 [Terriglobales bacterium]|jgi:uncharacterized membrane protein|nr:hypothetical protein [Terriglobales bacterium]